MAVVTLLAVVTALVVPQMRWSRDRAVRDEAEALADLFRAARERAVVTGRTHRVRLDFAASEWRLEWLPPTNREEEEAARPPRERPDLVPPRPPEAEFEPVPGVLGKRIATPRDVWLLEIDSTDARALGDVVTLRFGPEGDADAARVVVGNGAGDASWVVETHEFAEDVDVYDERRG